MRSIYYLIIISSFFLSCSVVKKTAFEVIVPPEFSFPPAIEDVVVLNNSPFFLIDSSQFRLITRLKEKNLYITEKDLYILDTIATHNVLDGFYAIAEDSPDKTLMKSQYIEIRFENPMDIPDPLSETSVRNFCEDHDADAIVSLEYIDLQIDIKFVNLYIVGSGYNVRADINLLRKNLWRIYDYSGLILYEHFLNDTLIWSNSALDYKQAYYGLPLTTDIVRNSFFDAGSIFAKKIIPYWQSVERVYYQVTGFDAVDYSLNKDYLLNLSEHSNKKKAYKACFNLALLSEKEDNLRNALKWLEIAEFKKPGLIYTEMYKKIIEERIELNETYLFRN